MGNLRSFFASLRHLFRFRILKMREKVLIILMDEEIILYKGLSKKTYSVKDNIKDIQGELQKFMAISPQVPFCLLLDRNHQELREESLPPLWLWDQLRLLYHKKQHWKSQGELYGYRFFKQDNHHYLQWVAISKSDPLRDWISWSQSVPNPFLGVYFVPFEAGVFIQKHSSFQNGYGMLIYALSTTKIHHTIFKGRRLLFSRSFSGEEDLKSSLHFLSRTYPDIHEKIQVFNLSPKISLQTSKSITTLHPNHFLHFLTTQKPTTLFLNISTSIQSLWLKRMALMTFLLSLPLTGRDIYIGMEHQLSRQEEESKIAFFQSRLCLINKKDTEKKKSALTHYQYIQSQQESPFPILTKLSPLIEQHHVKLKKLIWEDGKSLELIFAFPTQDGKHLFKLFKILLASLQHAFPQGHIEVLEAPWGSSVKETYKYPPVLPLPIAHLRLALP